MDAAQLTAIGAFVTGILGMIIAGMTWRSSASKEELNSLRSTIVLLQTENKRLVERMDDLENERNALKDWAEALFCQVRELGGIPAKYEAKTRPRDWGERDAKRD